MSGDVNYYVATLVRPWVTSGPWPTKVREHPGWRNRITGLRGGRVA